jgi:hypothetical protein
MPIVTIQVTREGTKAGVNSVTAEEKAALINGVSQLLLDVLNKSLDSSSRRSTPTIGVGALCARSTIAAGAQRRDDFALAVDLSWR